VRVHQPTVVELDLTRLSFLSSCGVTALIKDLSIIG
jgi:anti-anti-sigma regulatory factor